MTHARLRQQAGFTLVELLVALVIAAIIAGGIIQGVKARLDEQKQAATALQINTYANAVFAYQQANQSVLLSSTGPSTPSAITTAQLISSGLLPAGFSDITPYSQTIVARVLQPTAGTLDPVVATVGGNALTDVQVHGIAAQMSNQGGQGGFLDSRNGTTASGLGGWWSKAMPPYGINPGVGHVVAAVFLRMVATTDDSLHRHATAGAPQYNQMATDIDMGHHSLNNVKSINLDAGNSVNIGGSLLYGDGSNLATRSGSGNLYIQNSNGSGSGSIVQVHNITGDGSSTFTAYNISAANTLYAGGNVVAAGGVSANGNITTGSDVVANGAVYASNWLRTYGNTGWYSQSYGGGWYMQDSTWIRAYNNKSVYTAGTVEAGHIQSDSRMYAKEFIELDGVAAAGTGCSPNGLIGRTSTGGFLYCESGVWKSAGGFSSYQIVSSPGVASGNNPAYATCPSGYTLLGGGYQIVTTNYTVAYGPPISRPVSSTQWQVSASDPRFNSQYYAYALCAR